VPSASMVDPEPARVVTTPRELTALMRWFRVSATKVMPEGPSARA
jgi:hypothetical protein